MKKVNDAASELAVATMEYYRVKAHCVAAGSNVLDTDARKLRYAYAEMCDAQNVFATACETHVASE